MQQVTPGWRLVHIGFERDVVEVAGVNVWDACPWGPSLGRITVAHPQYPEQRHAMDVHRPPGSGVEFASGEFSNGVWGFYERDPADS
jgi:hypothetical protein